MSELWKGGKAFLDKHNLIELEVTLEDEMVLAKTGYWSAGGDHNIRVVGRDSGNYAYMWGDSYPPSVLASVSLELDRTIEALWLANTGNGDLVPFLSKLTEKAEELLMQFTNNDAELRIADAQ